MMSKIKFQKVVKLSHESHLPEHKELYNELLKELKININFLEFPKNSIWRIHKESSTLPYSQSIQKMRQMMLALKNVDRDIDVHIEARCNNKIDLEFHSIDIIDFDFDNNAVFSILYQSDEYILINNFGTALIVSSMKDGINTITVDFDDKDISICQHNNYNKMG